MHEGGNEGNEGILADDSGLGYGGILNVGHDDSRGGLSPAPVSREQVSRGEGSLEKGGGADSKDQAFSESRDLMRELEKYEN